VNISAVLNIVVKEKFPIPPEAPTGQAILLTTKSISDIYDSKNQSSFDKAFFDFFSFILLQ
jgi:hypothetical protein